MSAKKKLRGLAFKTMTEVDEAYFPNVCPAHIADGTGAKRSCEKDKGHSGPHQVGVHRWEDFTSREV